MDRTGQAIVALYSVLSFYNFGAMLVLQLMHYPLYAKVGESAFTGYMAANNRRAVLPAIVPGFLLLLCALALVALRPPAVPMWCGAAALALNVLAVLSTAIWQGKLHAQLARSGHSSEAIEKLVATNWIRTFAYAAQGALAMWMLLVGLGAGGLRG